MTALNYCNLFSEWTGEINTLARVIKKCIGYLESADTNKISNGFSEVSDYFAIDDNDLKYGIGKIFYPINKLYILTSADRFKYDIGYIVKIVKDIELYTLVVLSTDLEQLKSDLGAINQNLDRYHNSYANAKKLVDDLTKFKPNYMDKLSPEDAELVQLMTNSVINISQILMNGFTDIGNDVGKLVNKINSAIATTSKK